MRLSKLVLAGLGAAALLAGRPAAASNCWFGCGYHDHYEPSVTWYINCPWYPNYFGPPYPHTSYLPVFYPGTPAETAQAVHKQLVMMGIPPLTPPKPQEPLPAPKGEDKVPPKAKDIELPEIPGPK
jgi:hypothetical protein